MALKKKKKKQSVKKTADKKPQASKEEAREENKLIRQSDFYSRIKPKNNYYFFSDYFVIDNSTYGSVLTLLHNDGADNKLAKFWGVLVSLNNWANDEEFKDVRIRFINQARKRDDNWVRTKQIQSERVVVSDQVESSGFSRSDKATVGDNAEALDRVTEEIRTGAAYLDVRMHYLIKAPSLDILDKAVRRLNRNLRDHFDTVVARAKSGAQRHDLNMLLRSTVMNDERQFGFTSEEYAGFYNLVTHGIEDLTGEYVGQMRGDINASAVLFDIDKYRHHVVVASAREARTMSYTQEELSPYKPLKGADMWGVKIGQNALMNRHRVVHFVLNGSDIQSVGLDLSRLTADVNMSKGSLNPFEVFGEKHDEMNLFAAQTEKIILMALMMVSGDVKDESLIRTELNDLLADFYIDQNMWVKDASDAVNRTQVKLVGLPHSEYPRLPEFIAYIKQEYETLAQGERNEPARQERLKLLHGIFKEMLANNGDIFDTITSDRIDDADYDSRVIYDFSALRTRGDNVAMAQFVNVLSYAVRSLGKDDVVIVHGTELIMDVLKPYVSRQFDELFNKGVRVVYCYGDIDAVLDDKDFNDLDEADYTLFGRMSLNDIDRYEEILGREIPKNLNDLITADKDESWYLRRSFENVVFDCDLGLGLSVESEV